MFRKTVSAIMLSLLIVSMLTLAFKVQIVRAYGGTITINADGSITPPTAPVYSADNITYTLTGNITAGASTYGIVIDRGNVILDGTGCTLTGNGTTTAGIIIEPTNVTVNNMTITNFGDGIVIEDNNNNTLSGNNVTANNHSGITLSSAYGNILSDNNVANDQYGILLTSNVFGWGGAFNNTLSGNNIFNNEYGIYLDSSSNNNNVLSGNNVTANNYDGIDILQSSSGNTLSGNNVTANMYDGIVLYGCSGNTVSSNNIAANNEDGIDIAFSSNNTVFDNNVTSNSNIGILLDSYPNNRYPTNYNTISGNNITSNGEGIVLSDSSNNSVFHNNFVNNTIQFYTNDSTNTWDNGYPSGGNYWSDYNGTDSYSGPYQNVTGSDGLGDTPYIIDATNTDHYPLMTKYMVVHDVAVTNVLPSKAVVGQGSSMNITVTVANQGSYTETFNVITYLILPPPLHLAIVIDITEVNLDAGNNTTIDLAWNTTGYDIGNYTIASTAGPVPGETNTDDNTFSLAVKVTIPGDINGDFKVNLIDLVLLANAYGSHPGDTKWNPNADINGNGVVDLTDLVILALHYGQHYP